MLILQPRFNLPLNKINSVENCRLKIRGHCNHNLLLRIDVNHIAAVSDGGVDTLLAADNPPEVSVVHSAEMFAFDSARGCHLANPF